MTVTINGTTGVAVPLGSVSAPGVSNTTSSTTGIYNPTSTTLGIATNGVNALTIDATQNAAFAGNIGVAGSTVPANGMYLPAANTLGFATNTTAVARFDSSGNLQVGGTTVGNTTGYVNSRTNTRAWANFNGTSASPITPRSNYNVSSVTKNATGDYTLNFTTALADANYAYLGTGSGETVNVFIEGYSDATKTSSSLRILSYRPSTGSLADCTQVNVAIFGN